MKITAIILGLTIGALGCQDPDEYYRDQQPQQDPWIGNPVDRPLPDPQSCLLSDADRMMGIGVSVCGGDMGGGLVTYDKTTGRNVNCYRCYGEFNDRGNQPVPTEGCFVWRYDPKLAGLCVNSCKQCGSTQDNY